MVDLLALASWSRTDLVAKARELGVERPERMTRIELRDEIQRLSGPRGTTEEPRGLFGTARSMLASMVEAGLNMPEAAAVIRGEAGFDVRVKAQPPVATVTLAEIYAAQGHRQRALNMLDDVLAAEPDHEVARELKKRLESELEQKISERPASSPDQFVETTGEEIRTGKPPSVAPSSAVAVPETPVVPEASHADDEPPEVEAPDTRLADAEPPEVEPSNLGLLAKDQPEVEAPDAQPADDGPPPEDAPPNAGLLTEEQPEEEPNATLLTEEPLETEHDASRPPLEIEPKQDDRLETTHSTSSELGAEAALAESTPKIQKLPLDDALFFRVEPTGAEFYWELSPASVDRQSRRIPEGKAHIRVIGVRPRPEGSERIQVDVEVTTPTGSTRLQELRPPVVVRAALGWLSKVGFVPLSIAVDLDGGYRPPLAGTIEAESRALDRLAEPESPAPD